MSTNTGLLFVFGEVGTDVRDDEFNGWYWLFGEVICLNNSVDWYDNEHAPARLTVPGIKNALRYKALDDECPTYIAMYDTESPFTLQSDEYRSLALGASHRERELIRRLDILNRRIYELHMITSRNEELDAPPRFIQVVTAVVDPQTEINIEENTMVSGWLRTRSFKLVSAVEIGRGVDTEPAPNYLILHDFDNRDFLTSGFQTRLHALHHEVFPKNPTLKVRNFYLHKEIK